MLFRSRYIFLLAIYCLGALYVQAEDLPKSDSLSSKQSIVLEGAGIGGYWSISYERIFLKRKRVRLFGSAGTSVLRISNYKGKFDPSFSLPIVAGMLYGSKKHNLEVAISNTFISSVSSNSELEARRDLILNGAAHIGYRYAFEHKRSYLKLYYTAVFVDYIYFVNWAGIGIGYTF